MQCFYQLISPLVCCFQFTSVLAFLAELKSSVQLNVVAKTTSILNFTSDNPLC